MQFAILHALRSSRQACFARGTRVNPTPLSNLSISVLSKILLNFLRFADRKNRDLRSAFRYEFIVVFVESSTAQRIRPKLSLNVFPFFVSSFVTLLTTRLPVPPRPISRDCCSILFPPGLICIKNYLCPNYSFNVVDLAYLRRNHPVPRISAGGCCQAFCARIRHRCQH